MIRKEIIFILAALMLIACNDTENMNLPSVDHIDVEDVNLVRYDQLVQSLDTLNIKESYAQLSEKYPNITALYFNELLNLKSENKDSFYIYINQFLKADPIISLQESVDKAYPNLKSLEKELNLTQKYLKHYFPDYSMPNFYTYITEFGYQTIIFQDGNSDGIGVGLDLYLGNDFDYKKVDPQDPVFSDYLTRAYDRSHIVRNAMEIIVADIIGRETGKRLLDQMLYNGKKLYLLDQVMPEVNDTIIMAYSREDLEWVEENELQIWDYFIKNNLIYETNHLKINKYFNQGPHSPGMPSEAPGRTANYIGWQIISKYMSKYPDTTVSQLIAMTDSQKLMELSRYKPKRR